MKLTQSSVVFDEYNHTYTTADGKELGGVTSLLARQLFTDKYDCIPKSVLDRAAEYGTKVHNTLEVFDTLGVGDDPICDIYKGLVDGMEHVDSEYLVTDGEHIASKIDKVFTIDGESAILADIKTTSKLDEDYVSWQLSIYSYLFRLMNPEIKVIRLLAIWLPKPQYGYPAIVEVPAIDDAEVKALLDADTKGENYVPKCSLEPLTTKEYLPTIAPEFWNYVIDIETKIEELKEKQKEMRAKLLAAMAENDVKKIESDRIIVTRKLASTSERVDSKLLKEIYPDVYKEVIKTSTTSESLLIKIK